jgi:hypothetical protein
MKNVMILSLLALAGSAGAAPLTTGNLLVVRVGAGGTTSLSSSPQTTAWLEMTTTGTTSQTFTLSGGSAGSRLTLSGTGTSEGYTGGASGAGVFALTGYDAAVGAGGAANTQTARTTAVIDLNGNITWTSFTGTSGQNARSATTATGAATNTYVGQQNGQMLVSPFTTIATSNTRNVNIFNNTGSGNQLYFSTGSTTPGVGIWAYSGLPNASSTPTSVVATVVGTTFSGAAGSGTVSPYDFQFVSPTVLYVTDDRSATNGGGLQRYNLVSGVWTYAYTINQSGGNGYRSIAVGSDGLYVTDAATSNNSIFRIVDNGSASSSTITLVASAGTNYVFRGVEVIPTPGSAVLMALGGMACLRRRR